MKIPVILVIAMLQTSCLSIFMQPSHADMKMINGDTVPPTEKPYLMVTIEGHDLKIWTYMRYDKDGNFEHGKVSLKKEQSIVLENGWKILHSKNHVLINQTKVPLDQLNVFVGRDEVRIGGFIQAFER